MAITILADTLASELDIDLTRATRLLSVASALVNDYCPEAPEPIANESVLMGLRLAVGQRVKPGLNQKRRCRTAQNHLQLRAEKRLET